MSREGENRGEAGKIAALHYENFPVGSFLLPRKLRPHVHRVYAFARIADDLVDEMGDREGLQAYREGLRRALEAKEPRAAAKNSFPYAAQLDDLSSTAQEFAIPHALFFDLLEAFERDLDQSRYLDFDDLMSYCQKSADPIGRILLHIVDEADPENLRLSDLICTALQILNHCQDVKEDYLELGRVYLPADRLERHGVSDVDLEAPRVSAGLKRVLAELCDFCATSFFDAWPLPKRVGGRFGLELKAILHGACLVLDRMRRQDYEIFHRRPCILRADAVEIFLRSIFLPWPPRAARRC